MLDVELYGGRRGLLEHIRTRALYALGAYRDVRGIEWPAVRRLAFVCRGNICRSPYASARARALGVPSVSFGIDAADGAPADPVALRNARVRGLDLSAHQSARLHSSGLANGDLIVVFEPWQIAEVSRRRADWPPVISLLGVWARPIRPHIQDPHGRSDRYFQQCFALIDANVAALAGHMVRHGAQESNNETGAVLDASEVTADSREGTPV